MGVSTDKLTTNRIPSVAGWSPDNLRVHISTQFVIDTNPRQIISGSDQHDYPLEQGGAKSTETPL